MRSMRAYLVFGAIALVLAHILYSQWAIGELRSEAQGQVDMIVRLLYRAASKRDMGKEADAIILEIVEKRLNFPVIMTDAQGNPKAWKNVGIDISDVTEGAQERLKAMMGRMDQRNSPIPFERGSISGYIHYGDPSILSQLAWMPLMAGGAIALLVLIGLLGLRSIRGNARSASPVMA